MPARTIVQPLDPRNPAEVQQVVRRLVAAYDDPIAAIQIDFGTYDSGSGSRNVTFTAIDRLLNRYAPTLYRNKLGKSPGRWVLEWYMAATEYGTPISPGLTSTPTGKTFGNVGNLYTSETDYRGICQVVVGKIPGTYWIHAGIGGLLRSRGIDWVTGNDAPANTEAGDPEPASG